MERTVLLTPGDLQIPCKIHEPDCGNVTRVVIGVHGFCGHKDNAVLQSVAEEMGMYGTVSVCFDFPAHGESPMSDRALSLRNCVAVLSEVARWVAQQYPGTRKCIFASGFGAFVTVQALEELDDILERVCLVLQTPDFHMADSLLAMTRMSEEAFWKAGRVTIGRVGDRRIEVPFSFYEELRSAISYMDFEQPMLLLHGECDEIVKIADVEHFRRINEQSSLVIIPGADHQFRGAGQWDMVVDLTRDWFLCEEVLLCEYE